MGDGGPNELVVDPICHEIDLGDVGELDFRTWLIQALDLCGS